MPEWRKKKRLQERADGGSAGLGSLWKLPNGIPAADEIFGAKRFIEGVRGRRGHPHFRLDKARTLSAFASFRHFARDNERGKEKSERGLLIDGGLKPAGPASLARGGGRHSLPPPTKIKSNWPNFPRGFPGIAHVRGGRVHVNHFGPCTNGASRRGLHCRFMFRFDDSGRAAAQANPNIPPCCTAAPCRCTFWRNTAQQITPHRAGAAPGLCYGLRAALWKNVPVRLTRCCCSPRYAYV